jgi:hypothetical protein
MATSCHIDYSALPLRVVEAGKDGTRPCSGLVLALAVLARPSSAARATWPQLLLPLLGIAATTISLQNGYAFATAYIYFLFSNRLTPCFSPCQTYRTRCHRLRHVHVKKERKLRQWRRQRTSSGPMTGPGRHLRKSESASCPHFLSRQGVMRHQLCRSIG